MSESEIRGQIHDYLQRIGAMVWVNYQPTFRFRKGAYQSSIGVADLVGIYKGKPLAVEVKTDKGKLRFEQGQFINNFRAQGGIAFVARSVEDVIARLKEAESASSGTRLH